MKNKKNIKPKQYDTSKFPKPWENKKNRSPAAYDKTGNSDALAQTRNLREFKFVKKSSKKRNKLKK